MTEEYRNIICPYCHERAVWAVKNPTTGEFEALRPPLEQKMRSGCSNCRNKWWDTFWNVSIVLTLIAMVFAYLIKG
jgi:hypothetical protein